MELSDVVSFHAYDELDGVKSKIVLFILALIVWILLCWPFDWQHFIVGVFVAALVAFLTGDMFINPVRPERSNGVKRPHVLKSLRRFSV